MEDQEKVELSVKQVRILILMRVIANILVLTIIAGAIAIITWRTMATADGPGQLFNL